MQCRVTSVGHGTLGTWHLALGTWRYCLPEWQRGEHVLEKNRRKNTLRQRPVLTKMYSTHLAVRCDAQMPCLSLSDYPKHVVTDAYSKKTTFNAPIRSRAHHLPS